MQFPPFSRYSSARVSLLLPGLSLYLWYSQSIRGSSVSYRVKRRVLKTLNTKFRVWITFEPWKYFDTDIKMNFLKFQYDPLRFFNQSCIKFSRLIILDSSQALFKLKLYMSALLLFCRLCSRTEVTDSSGSDPALRSIQLLESSLKEFSKLWRCPTALRELKFNKRNFNITKLTIQWHLYMSRSL